MSCPAASMEQSTAPFAKHLVDNPYSNGVWVSWCWVENGIELYFFMLVVPRLKQFL